MLLSLLFVSTTIMAQQNKDASAGEETLFEKVTNIEKKQDNFHFLLNLNNTKWNVFVKGMLENEGFSKANGAIEKGKYRTALGYLAGLEYYPLKNSNLHFFLTYVGRNYSYTDRAKAYGCSDYSTNRISLGYIWQLPMF